MSAAHDQATDIMVELADTLVADLDIDRVLHLLTDRCVQLLDAPAAAVLVADDRGELRLLAASPEQTARVRLFESPSPPSSWSYATGQPMTDADLDDPDPRWGAFAAQARAQGFRSALALPMRTRGEVIGVLSLLRSRVGPFTGEEIRLAQALANVASVALLLQYDTVYRAVLAAQTQQLLTGRVAVERARGVLAELLGIDVDAALDELRRHAERTARTLHATAAEVVTAGPASARLNGAAPVLLVHRVAADTLAELRGLVRQRLAAAGLKGSIADAFHLAIHEAATNVVEHAFGGRLWLWRHRDNVWCEISDDGPGLPAGYTVRTEAPSAGDLDHAGLWLIRRICPDMQLTSTPQGTRLLLRQPLPVHPVASTSDEDSISGG